ncbi:EAL domain-containing protein [Variovorax sp. J22G73]|uniref:EAL domain-containing protein n=1 Tax=unclassified Variovorax TaxID=663243 RepID=UPI00257821CA|nr:MULTISPECIES: EAL domain-containing protein [unclassified Variovorax]MDM0010507.1 EAL domain-containing protein [Variovorax sp. J22R203]MDM0102910.1 EAL domain-containing protein [Variovorax sp. J22G73]
MSLHQQRDHFVQHDLWTVAEGPDASFERTKRSATPREFKQRVSCKKDPMLTLSKTEAPCAPTAVVSACRDVRAYAGQDVRGAAPVAFERWPELRAAAPRACAYVFISNLPHLAQAYGQDFASAASLEVQRRLCAHFITSAAHDMARLRDDCFLLWANDAFVCGASNIRELPQAVRSASQPIETLLAVLGAEPVRAMGIVALVQLHVDWIEMRAPGQLGTSEIELALWTAQPFPDSRESRADGWCQRYRADMDVALRVSEALRTEALSFAWQPVVHAGSNHGTLYHAGRVRLPASRSEPALLAQEVFLPCLQRLGLARAFDRIAVRQALAALRRQPAMHIGVGICAQSVRLDHWWASLCAALDEEPSLASRLVIEIVGSATLTEHEAARDFCVQMQLRGCRIGLRDIGGGNDNLAALQSCGPDIVKLDASLLRRARGGAFGVECLRGMISLCTHVATQVVVDGIEREEDMHIASRVGAQWLQGYGVRATEAAGARATADADAHDGSSGATSGAACVDPLAGCL